MTTTTTLASHSLLLALPAFVPAVLLVGVIVFVAVRDRRQGDDEDDEGDDGAVDLGGQVDSGPDSVGTDSAERR